MKAEGLKKLLQSYVEEVKLKIIDSVPKAVILNFVEAMQVECALLSSCSIVSAFTLSILSRYSPKSVNPVPIHFILTLSFSQPPPLPSRLEFQSNLLKDLRATLSLSGSNGARVHELLDCMYAKVLSSDFNAHLLFCCSPIQYGCYPSANYVNVYCFVTFRMIWLLVLPVAEHPEDEAGQDQPSSTGEHHEGNLQAVALKLWGTSSARVHCYVTRICGSCQPAKLTLPAAASAVSNRRCDPDFTSLAIEGSKRECSQLYWMVALHLLLSQHFCCVPRWS